MKNFELKSAARANLGLLTSFAVVALTIGVVACGSDKKNVPIATDPNGNLTNPNVVQGTNVTTPASCQSSKGRSYSGADSSVSLTPTGGTAAPLAKTFYISNATTNANDLNKTHKIAAFDYDYCDFTYDFGYGSGPLTPFHNALFYLVNGTPGTPLQTGTYTVGSSGTYIMVNKSAGAVSSVVQTSTGGMAGQKCSSNYAYPASGTIELTSVPQVDPNQTRFNTGLAGTFNLTLDNNSTISGSFTSGGCSAGDNTAIDATRVSACTCSL